MASGRTGGPLNEDPVFETVDTFSWGEPEAEAVAVVVQSDAKRSRPTESHYIAPSRHRPERRFISRVDREVVRVGHNCPQCQANTDPRRVPVHPGCDCEVVTVGVEHGVDPEAANAFERGLQENSNLVFIKPEEATPGFEEGAKEAEKEKGGEGEEGEGKEEEKEPAEEAADSENWGMVKFAPETMLVLPLEDARWSDVEAWLEEVAMYVETGQYVISIANENVRSFADLEELLTQAEETEGAIDSDYLVLSLVHVGVGFE